jgi:tRNA(Ile)-lysidine synthase
MEARQLHTLEQQLVADWPTSQWRDTSLLVAVSGGADSVALLRALHRLKRGGSGRLLVAHFNHAVRNSEAENDAAFVAELCRQLDVECHLGKRDTDEKSTDEDSLRADRYRFLQSTAERQGARYVVTAHTADDQIETIVHRFVRGTGLAGLAGVRRSRPLGEAVVLMRPMLGIHREQVLAYLQTIGQSFCEDSTNCDTNYTRNRIRRELLPQLARDYNLQVNAAILKLGVLAADSQSIIELVVEKLLEARVHIDSPGDLVITCDGLAAADRPLLRELFALIWRRQAWPLGEMGFNEWERLATLAIAPESQTHDLPGPVRAKKKGASLSLTRLS